MVAYPASRSRIVVLNSIKLNMTNIMEHERHYLSMLDFCCRWELPSSGIMFLTVSHALESNSRLKAANVIKTSCMQPQCQFPTTGANSFK